MKSILVFAVMALACAGFGFSVRAATSPINESSLPAKELLPKTSNIFGVAVETSLGTGGLRVIDNVSEDIQVFGVTPTLSYQTGRSVWGLRLPVWWADIDSRDSDQSEVRLLARPVLQSRFFYEQGFSSFYFGGNLHLPMASGNDPFLVERLRRWKVGVLGGGDLVLGKRESRFLFELGFEQDSTVKYSLGDPTSAEEQFPVQVKLLLGLQFEPVRQLEAGVNFRYWRDLGNRKLIYVDGFSPPVRTEEITTAGSLSTGEIFLRYGRVSAGQFFLSFQKSLVAAQRENLFLTNYGEITHFFEDRFGLGVQKAF